MVRLKNRKPIELGLRNVVRLGYVSLFTDLSTEMVLGVLPFFIIKELGATAAILGIIEGIAEAVNYFFRVVSGVLTDKIGKRKPFVLLGYALSSITKPLFAVTSTWSHAFIIRVFDRSGKGIRTSPRDALISDSAKKSEAGKAFGLHRSLDQIGAVGGPIIAFAFIPLIGIRGIFWLSFIPAAIALLILLFFVQDINTPAKHRSLFENARSVLDRQFITLLSALVIFAMGAYNFSFVLLKAGSLGINQNFIPLVYVCLNIAVVIVGLPAGIVADKIGKIPVLISGYAVFIIASLTGLLLNGNPIYAFPIAIIFGCYLGMAETVQRAIIPDYVSVQLKGTAYALYYSIMGIGSLIANSIFGILWTNIGYVAAFEYSIIMAIAGTIALLIFFTKKKRLIKMA
ncbi:MFS transporter [[Eubacterium] cellulosolvens]